MLKRMFFLPSELYNKILFRIRGVTYGKGLKLRGIISICRSGKIVLGDNVTIQSCRYANPLGDRCVFEIQKGAQLQIGNNVGISSSIFKSEKKIVIEDDVMIGAGCMIMDTDSHPIDYEKRISGQNEFANREMVVLKKGCFIGARTIILKGVTVGERSVIAAGSVVSKSIPDNEVWGGNPVKLIKKI